MSEREKLKDMTVIKTMMIFAVTGKGGAENE